MLVFYIIMFGGFVCSCWILVWCTFGWTLYVLFSCVCCSCGCLFCCFGGLAVASVVVSGLRVALFIWLFGVGYSV